MFIEVSSADGSKTILNTDHIEQVNGDSNGVLHIILSDGYTMPVQESYEELLTILTKTNNTRDTIKYPIPYPAMPPCASSDTGSTPSAGDID